MTSYLTHHSWQRSTSAAVALDRRVCTTTPKSEDPPVFMLHEELLSRIFLLVSTITTSQYIRRHQWERHSNPPYTWIYITHVCHLWRATSLRVHEMLCAFFGRPTGCGQDVEEAKAKDVLPDHEPQENYGDWDIDSPSTPDARIPVPLKRRRSAPPSRT